MFRLFHSRLKEPTKKVLIKTTNQRFQYETMASNEIQFPSKLLTHYKPTLKLGEGAYASVYKGNIVDNKIMQKYNTKQVAIKVMNRTRNPFALLECELLKSVDHRNVLKVYEVLEDKDSVFLVTELLEGPELFEVLVDREEPYDEATVLMFAEQMLGAIEACHKQNFAHLDVKIENMVFRGEPVKSELVLVDFGAADRFVRAPYADKSQHYIEGLDDETRPLSSRPAGTIMYSSPEVMNGFFSSRSDVWSVGVCLFVLLTGKRPFDSEKPIPLEAEKSVISRIRTHGGNRENKPAIGLSIPSDIPAGEQTIQFLKKLTAGHPKDRCSATEALAILRKNSKFKSFYSSSLL